MSAGPIVVEIFSLFFLVLFILHKYANFRQQNPITLVATFIAWYFSLMIIILLPLDISLTTYRQCIKEHQQISTTTSTPLPNSTQNTTTRSNIEVYCKEPWSLISPHVFPVLWRIIYWTSQALTWLILPFMQSFVQSGEFHLSGKIRGALIANAIYYGTYLAIFGVLLIYVAIKHNIDGQKLKVIGITASNTWGLFLLVLLLGYGLVAVPRSLWFRSTTALHMKQIYFKIAKLHGEKCDAEENLEDILTEVKKVAEKINYNHPLRNCVDLILKKCPESFRNTLRRNVEDYQDFSNSSSSRDMSTEKSLVNLHTRLIKSLHVNNRANSQWSKMIEDAFLIEDILLNETNTNRKFMYTTPIKRNFISNKICNPMIEWFYYCLIKRYMLKIIAVVCMLVTVIVIWSEMTFFNKKPVLSIFALFLSVSRIHYNYFSIEIIGCLTIAYLCFCAYYTIFKMRIFNYYYLDPNHQTNENSLIFSGTLLCRLTSPLCYNFLGLVHLDSHITKDTQIEETQFTSIMGHMDVISFISDGFNIYFPMLIFIFCLATFFNFGGHILHFFGFEQFIGDADVTQDLIEDGKNLVKREKRRIQQNDPEIAMRHREVAERLRENYSSKGKLSSSASKSSITDKTNKNKNINDSKVKEYRDIPPYSDYQEDGNSSASLFSSQSNKTRLINDEEAVDYESTTRNKLFEGSKNHSLKNMKGIFDNF